MEAPVPLLDIKAFLLMNSLDEKFLILILRTVEMMIGDCKEINEIVKFGQRFID